MPENGPTQLPKPPELQPLPAKQNKLWPIISYILIGSGLLLVGWGVWLFYQSYLEVNRPPAPILKVAVSNPETPTLQPTPTRAIPTPTPTVQNSPTAAPTASSTPQPTATPEPEKTARPDDSLQVTEAKLVEELTLSQELVLTPEPTREPGLTLEDNPLIVEQEEPSPAAAEAGPPLNLPESAGPTRIVADSINLDAPVIEVGWKQVEQEGILVNVWTVADFAAGWHKNTMLPGQGGNIVLSGHHNIKGEVFRHIVDLEPGAVVSLYVGDQRYDYTVEEKFILKDKGEPQEVRIANARWIGPFNEERLTMVTCWPYNNNTHRVIVIAKPL